MTSRSHNRFNSIETTQITKRIFQTWSYVATEHFARLGGSVRYEGYERWHALGLTAISALILIEDFQSEKMEHCKKILPREIFKCDGLIIRIQEYLKSGVNFSDKEHEQLANGVEIAWLEFSAGASGFHYTHFNETLLSALDELRKSQVNAK